jgi:hypothetical protein
MINLYPRNIGMEKRRDILINLSGIRKLFPHLKIRMNQDKQENVTVQYTFVIADEKQVINHSVRPKKLSTIRSLERLEKEVINICRMLTDHYAKKKG